MWGWEGEKGFEVVEHFLKEGGDAGKDAEFSLESDDGLGGRESGAKG